MDHAEAPRARGGERLDRLVLAQVSALGGVPRLLRREVAAVVGALVRGACQRRLADEEIGAARDLDQLLRRRGFLILGRGRDAVADELDDLRGRRSGGVDLRDA